MASFQLITSEALPLTHALAIEFRDLPGSPTERELNQGRMRHLAQKIEQGLTVPFHWATATMPDGQKYRINGQHSSTLLANLNGGFPEKAIVYRDEYTVDGPDGLASLFRQFDDRKSGRTAADVAGAYQGLEDALKDTAKPIAKLGIEGVSWYRRYIEKVPTPVGDEQYRLFHESQLHRFLLWLNDVFSIKTPELKRVPVVAAMHATFEKNEEEARKFWMQVARGGKEYEDEAPSTVLDSWLKSLKEEKTDVGPGDYFRGCVYAWNAHREEKTLKDIRFDLKRASRPIAD